MLKKVGRTGEVTLELSPERDNGLFHVDIHGRIIPPENSWFRGLNSCSERPIEGTNGEKEGGGRLWMRWGCLGCCMGVGFSPSSMGRYCRLWGKVVTCSDYFSYCVLYRSGRIQETG